LWLFTLASIRGLGVNKWINDLGGLAAIVTTSILLVVGALVFHHHLGMTIPEASSLLPTFADWRTFSALGVICLGLVGLELGCVMGDEIREPRRTVPRAALLGGVLSGLLYASAILVVLLALPTKEISVVTGILQTLASMGARIGLGWLHFPVAFVLAGSIFGALSAWISGAGRIPFVAGVDRYLPTAFSRLHPRWQTPHIALMVQAIAATFAILLSFLGQDVKVREAYDILLALAVFTQLIPFVYLFSSLMRVAGTPGGLYRSYWWPFFLGLFGLIATVAAMTTALIPPPEIKSVLRFEGKFIIGLLVFAAPAVVLFRWYAPRRHPKRLP
jgi:glutamate:GABA antiporter